MQPAAYKLSLRAATLSDEDFFEWFRGLVDGEGCFIIVPSKNNTNFLFRFHICLHKDDKNMIEFIVQRLKIGKVYFDDHFVYFNVFKQSELKILFYIFDKYPLNTNTYRGPSLFFNNNNNNRFYSSSTGKNNIT